CEIVRGVESHVAAGIYQIVSCCARFWLTTFSDGESRNRTIAGSRLHRETQVTQAGAVYGRLTGLNSFMRLESHIDT
ncbi:MAG: hypothetical protein ACI8P0_000151, partial [Planctomycetaceae bacterium]